MPLVRQFPAQLTGPRAYFTDWNRRGNASQSSTAGTRTQVLRKLKALLLTKRNVVFAASDFNSSIALNILIKYPELLDKGILLPALRIDRESLEEVTTDPAAKAFISERSITAVSWSLDENVDWFRGRFVEELGNPDSVIRGRMLEMYPKFDHNSLAIALSVDGKTVQDVIDQHAAFLPSNARSLLLNYRSLLYHMSGARVVHSESFLPQENLVDCDVLSTGERTRLSEDAIFFKIFVEQALATLGRKTIPIEVLDQISISDILTLRSVYESSGFIENYDKMVSLLLKASISRDSRGAILHLEELAKVQETLFSNFTRHFETELSDFAKSKRITAGNSVIGPATSVALCVSGFVLGPTGVLIASLLSLAKDSESTRSACASLINLFRVFSTSTGFDSENQRQNAKMKLLRENLGEMASNKSLLEAAEKYSALVAEAYRL
jgi:hypothetical protein